MSLCVGPLGRNKPLLPEAHIDRFQKKKKAVIAGICYIM